MSSPFIYSVNNLPCTVDHTDHNDNGVVDFNEQVRSQGYCSDPTLQFLAGQGQGMAVLPLFANLPFAKWRSAHEALAGPSVSLNTEKFFSAITNFAVSRQVDLAAAPT